MELLVGVAELLAAIAIGWAAGFAIGFVTCWSAALAITAMQWLWRRMLPDDYHEKPYN